MRLFQAMVLGPIEGPSLVAASRHLPTVSRRPQPRFIDGVVHVSFMASVRHKVLKLKHTYLLSCIRCIPPSVLNSTVPSVDTSPPLGKRCSWMARSISISCSCAYIHDIWLRSGTFSSDIDAIGRGTY